MNGEEESKVEPVQLPVVPGQTRTAVLAELSNLQRLIEGFDEAGWEQQSAIPDWKVGDVVTHLDLAFRLYTQVIEAAAAGRADRGMWKTLGQISKNVVPAAAPALNALNSAIPRLLDRTLPRETIKSHFVSSARGLEQALESIGPQDYSRSVYWQGKAWPLSFVLAMLLNELAVHGWDMVSADNAQAELGLEARTILPWFYWSGTPYMLQPSTPLSGTIQVRLANPEVDLWWSFVDSRKETGTGLAPNPEVTISSQSGTFVLILVGRILPRDALRFAAVEVTGKEEMARAFLGGWKLL